MCFTNFVNLFHTSDTATAASSTTKISTEASTSTITMETTTSHTSKGKYYMIKKLYRIIRLKYKSTMIKCEGNDSKLYFQNALKVTQDISQGMIYLKLVEVRS